MTFIFENGNEHKLHSLQKLVDDKVKTENISLQQKRQKTPIVDKYPTIGGFNLNIVKIESQIPVQKNYPTLLIIFLLIVIFLIKMKPRGVNNQTKL